jgi:hypothetical protein
LKIFESVFIFLKIFATLPVSTNEAEIVFHTTVNQNIHREIKIKESEVLNNFFEKEPRKFKYLINF